MVAKVALTLALLLGAVLAQGDLPAPTNAPDAPAATDAPESTDAPDVTDPPQPTPPATDAPPASTLGSCCRADQTCPPNYPRCLPAEAPRMPGDVECCQADPCNGVVRCPTWRPAPVVATGSVPPAQSCCTVEPCSGIARCGPAEIPIKIISKSAPATTAASATTAAAAGTTAGGDATTAAAETTTAAAPTGCCSADPCQPGVLRCPASSGVGPLGKLPAATCGCLQQAVCPCRTLVEAVVVDSSAPSCPCAGAPTCGCAVAVPPTFANPSFSVPQAIVGAAAQIDQEHAVHGLTPAFTNEMPSGVPTGLVGVHRGSRCGCIHMPKCPCRASWVKPEFKKNVKFTSKNLSPEQLARKQARKAKRRAERQEAEAIALGKAPVKANANLTEADSVRSLGPRVGDCSCSQLVTLHLLRPSHCPCLNAQGQAAGWVAPRMRKSAQHKTVPAGSLSCCTADPCSGAPRCPENTNNVAVVSGTFVARV